MKSRKEENIKPNNIALAHLEFAILSIALIYFRIYTVRENINVENVKSKGTNFLPADRQLMKQIASSKDFIAADYTFWVDYDLKDKNKLKLCDE